MRLFTKTLLFFVGVISLQAALTIVIITNIISKNNLEDAKKELGLEAATVFESYNSWKRNLWMHLIDLKNDSKLKELFKIENQFFINYNATNYLRKKLITSGFDCMVVKSSIATSSPDIIPFTYSPLTLSSSEKFIRERPHPYIHSIIMENRLSLVGVLRLGPDAGYHLDIFIIKWIDENFCKNLTVTRVSKACFFVNNKQIVGALQNTGFQKVVHLEQMENAYREYYNVNLEHSGYNIAVRKLGAAGGPENSSRLFLVTFVTNIHYTERLNLITRIVLYVCMASAAVAIALSLFLSKKISNPIKNLLLAMKKVKNGRYNTKVAIKANSEIRQLFQGFNDMAMKLHQDKKTMENYIHEIVVLKDYNEKIIQSIRTGIVIINTDLTVGKTNSFFLEYFNLIPEKIMGKKINRVDIGAIDTDILKKARAIINGKKNFYSKIKRVDDKKILEIKLYPLRCSSKTDKQISGCVLIADDISRKIELEEKIFQAEKISSISMLSAGVAHEINNPLSSIMSNVQNLIVEENDQDKQVSLKWIEQETIRIARTVRELLNFASSADNTCSHTDVNGVISQVLSLISYSIKKEKDVTITTSLEHNIPPAAISEDELKQIIINLVKNSLQAVDSKGRVEVSTYRRAEQGKITIAVKDNGSGIHKEHLPHIFDPFFTTKNNGEGTGLGLSVVYGIVNNNQGQLNIKSREGTGTTVHIVLPVYNGTKNDR
ncbi:MAG: ATP-binding protein [Spirochaetota bacterium]